MNKLTREEILAMVPGRELDALVAKHVKFPNHTHPLEEIKGWCSKYSTDVSEAWKVAEQYPIATVERVEIFVGNIEVKAALWEGFDYRDPIEVTAKTAPEAICKAALLAVLEDINLPGEETE